MKKPVLHQLLQLSFGQYVEVWSGLIFEHYQIGMSDEELFGKLKLSAEDEARFSVEYSAILMTIAALSLDVKPKLTSEKYHDRLIDQMAENAYQKIMPDADKETVQYCFQFFRTKLKIFGQICKNIASKDASKRSADLAGFARYLVAQVDDSDEEKNAKAIERLGILLSEASDCFIRLVLNSVQDTIRLDGKPSFSVQK